MSEAAIWSPSDRRPSSFAVTPDRISKVWTRWRWLANREEHLRHRLTWIGATLTQSPCDLLRRARTMSRTDFI